MKTATLFRFVLSLAASATFLGSAIMVSADESLVPFSFDNREVNAALVALYEGQPTIWKKEQLYLIGLCYVAEKRLDDAQALFGKLREQDPSNARVLRALGNIHHMKGAVDEATKLYQQAWREGQDVSALKQLSVLKLQAKDIAGLKPLIEDLLAHQTESLEIQKILLAYSLMVDDKETGGRIYESVVRKLSKDTVENNEDLRKLLLMVTARYKAAAEAAESGRKVQGKDGSGPRD